MQDVELHGGSENISIQCVFASGSQARGCHVEITNISLNITMNITRSGSPLSQIAEQTVSGLAPGSYEVLIFDMESDGSVHCTPSYVGHVIVSDNATLSTITSATPTTKGRPALQIVTIVTILGDVEHCGVSVRSLVPMQAPPRFYLAAVAKNREKAWDQNYVTTGNGGLGWYVMWTQFCNDGNVPTHNVVS